MEKREVRIEINGMQHEAVIDPRMLLCDFIRHVAGLLGTHVGCEHGVCGVCTVQFEAQPVRSCLLFAVQADGRSVRTVEGLMDGEQLSPLQQAFRDTHALQCGFCTPGVLMSLEPHLVEGGALSDDRIREIVAGILCRCTGYESIVDAFRLTRQRQPGPS